MSTNTLPLEKRPKQTQEQQRQRYEINSYNGSVRLRTLSNFKKEKKYNYFNSKVERLLLLLN
jgi:hypothetical protein